ncbi:MAG: hypothetical protein ABEL76_08065, partial [Bradymonadaceae bacterium]
MTDPSEPAEGDRATAGGDRSSEDLPAETDAPREPGVRDVLDLARRALDEGIVPLVLPWVGFLVVKLAILGPLTVGLVANMNLDADLQSHLQPPVTLEDYRQILPFPLEITVAALLVIPLLLHLELIYKSGLFRNLRELADRGPDAFDGAAEALARPLDDFGHLLAASVVWSLIVGLGTLFCVLPGLAAGFALSPYMYIVATRDTNLTDPLWTSIDWVKRHWGILLVVFALGF